MSEAPGDARYHAPVLLHEVLAFLANAKSVLDGTLGGGGHSEALLMKGARVTGIDRDPEALASARARLAAFEESGSFSAVLTTYDAIDETPELTGRTFDGMLLDLGVSSRQFDSAERGFTFREGAPLDMRMGSDEGPTAADLLNDADESELTRVFKEYGDEPRAAKLAREVVRRRAREPFATSDDFVKAIRGAQGPRSGPSEFARLFQALRIAVNDELDGLRRALPLLRARLEHGGTLVVITYHSGEDRIVKNFFRDWSKACVCPQQQPMCTCGGIAAGETLTRRPVLPRDEEIARNPRARSAKLRAWRAAT